MKVKGIQVLSALCVSLLAAMPLTSQAQTKLRFGYETPRSDSQHIAAQKFNELLKAKTGGKLELQLFPDSALGNAQALINGVRGGTIDLEMSGSNNFTGLVPVLNVLDVPFLFKDDAHVVRVLDGKTGDDLLATLDAQGMKGLAFWDNGWRNVTNSKHPVRTPADVKGLKIRTSASPMNIEAFRLLGANPISMPVSELYTALETKAVDAQEHPLGVLWSTKFYEVQKYLSLTRHAYSPLIVVMNKAKFDALSPDLQKALVESAREAAQYQRQLNAQNLRTIIDGVKKSGMQVVEDLDTKPFMEATKSVKDTFNKQYGDTYTKQIDAQR
ncbi:TRAP transporter substrate-binding protein [Uliginosibacterium sp. sgz301328]|uniref:TRAP transporter substrate-binding protein n=1 Tax=Uliginosibacterium sp. sgz301328 TaxID=3243764 RepID=UPI00359E6ECB